jgi:hypothetical protein
MSQSTKMLKQTETRGGRALLTWRNTGAVALFLYGTTFLWLTPAFVGNGKTTEGTAWTVTQILVVPTILGVLRCGLGDLQGDLVVGAAAMGSAIFGFAPLIPYWIAAHSVVGTGTSAQAVGFHAAGNAIVLILLLAPRPRRWIEHQADGPER